MPTTARPYSLTYAPGLMTIFLCNHSLFFFFLHQEHLALARCAKASGSLAVHSLCQKPTHSLHLIFQSFVICYLVAPLPAKTTVKMRAQSLPILAILALSANAVPFAGSHQHLHRRNPVPSGSYSAPAAGASSSSGGDTFDINITNNCKNDLEFGIYQVSASFAMNEVTTPVSIASGSEGSIAAPYHGIGMRLSGTAGSGAADQWNAQALFEFGFSGWSGIEGTAYDLSVMGGDIGVAVYPGNKDCPSKTCTPSSCSADQGWTSAGQVDQGSPADTVCYHGKTNFRVVWCP